MQEFLVIVCRAAALCSDSKPICFSSAWKVSSRARISLASSVSFNAAIRSWLFQAAIPNHFRPRLAVTTYLPSTARDPSTCRLPARLAASLAMFLRRFPSAILARRVARFSTTAFGPAGTGLLTLVLGRPWQRAGGSGWRCAPAWMKRRHSARLLQLLNQLLEAHLWMLAPRLVDCLQPRCLRQLHRCAVHDRNLCGQGTCSRGAACRRGRRRAPAPCTLWFSTPRAVSVDKTCDHFGPSETTCGPRLGEPGGMYFNWHPVHLRWGRSDKAGHPQGSENHNPREGVNRRGVLAMQPTAARRLCCAVQRPECRTLRYQSSPLGSSDLVCPGQRLRHSVPTMEQSFIARHRPTCASTRKASSFVPSRLPILVQEVRRRAARTPSARGGGVRR